MMSSEITVREPQNMVLRLKEHRALGSNRTILASTLTNFVTLCKFLKPL